LPFSLPIRLRQDHAENCISSDHAIQPLTELSSSSTRKTEAHQNYTLLTGYFITVAVFLSLAWLGLVVPPMMNGQPPAGLELAITMVIQSLDLGVTDLDHERCPDCDD